MTRGGPRRSDGHHRFAVFRSSAATQRAAPINTVATVHGFRSAFRDWAAECTNFTNETCEAALAHVIENKAEAAYRRGNLFEKRRKLMDAWAVYCAAPKPGKIVAFKR